MRNPKRGWETSLEGCGTETTDVRNPPESEHGDRSCTGHSTFGPSLSLGKNKIHNTFFCGSLPQSYSVPSPTPSVLGTPSPCKFPVRLFLCGPYPLLLVAPLRPRHGAPDARAYKGPLAWTLKWRSGRGRPRRPAPASPLHRDG